MFPSSTHMTPLQIFSSSTQLSRALMFLIKKPLTSPPPKKINLDSLELTVYHRFDDVSHAGKKMQLFFAGQGPFSARLLKRQPFGILNQK